MKGVHFWWARPNVGNPNGLFEDFRMIQMMISALYWKKYNEEIVLYCDTNTKEFLNEFGISELYDEIKTDLVDNIPNHINTNIYYDALKFYVFNDIKEEFCHLDTDLIYKKRFIPKNIFQYLHREKIGYPIYPHPSLFLKEEDVNLFGNDWEEEYTPNTAFFYSKKSEIFEELFEQSQKYFNIDYVHNVDELDEYSVKLLFVAQRLLGKILEKNGLIDNYMVNDVWLPFITDWTTTDKPSNWDEHAHIQHLWMRKVTYMNNITIYHDDIVRMLDEIKFNFPQYFDSAFEIVKKHNNWFKNIPKPYTHLL